MPRQSFQDSYEKIKLLGEGAFGAAYLVRQKELRQLQVAKEIRISHLTDKQREGAIAESEVLRMLKHPNIIAYINSFSEGPRMYIVMEYADGGDLAGKIKERKDMSTQFEEWEIMRIFVQLVLALNYIHSRKVLHRDLKPLNVFLTIQGIVKLGDFGIARILDSSTAGAQTTIGTPHYLSPEIVNNEAYGLRSDLWSLGVVTYELAALRVPFGGNSLPAVAMKIMGAEPEPLTARSAELNWIVFGLLSKEPQQRPRLEAVQRLPFVQKYIEELLYYSRETGAGGCEAMTKSLEPLPDPPEKRSKKTGRPPQVLDKQEAAHAEFVRTRQAALEAKRRAEAETATESNEVHLKANSREREPRTRPKMVEESPQLTGKEREAEVRRRARAERDELDAAHWDALNKAMREHQEEKRRLELRIKSTEALPVEESYDRSPEPTGGSIGASQTCKDKLAEEAEYLQKLAEARKEQAQERRRLAEKVAARDRAGIDDEVSAGSGEEVDSDKENANSQRHCRRLPDVPFTGESVNAAMLLEIPFTDKVKPKPKLSSEGRASKMRTSESRPRPAQGTELRPPVPPKLVHQSTPPTRAESIRTELGLRTSSRSKATPGRASGTPAQWLRSVSCDRSERSSVLEKLPPTRSRPSLDTAYSASPAAPPAAPRAPQPPTPQGAGDVSQLQDALAHALCGIEGIQAEAIPEEIVNFEGEGLTIGSEDVVGQMTLISDWKDTYD